MRIETYTIGIEFDSRSVSKGLKKVDRDIKGLGRQAKKTGKGIGKSLGGVGVGAGLAGGGIARFLPLVSAGLIGQKFISTIKDIEKATVSVGKTTGLAGKELESLKDTLLGIGTELAVPTESLFTIAQVAGQLGIQGVEGITKFTEAFAKLEIASDRTVSGELGAQTFAKFLDLSGAGIDAAENVASALTFLGNTSKTTEGKILRTAQEIAKGTALFDLGAGSILGLATAFDELGIESEVSGSAAFKFFRKVNTAARTGDGLDDFLKITKLTSDEFKRLAEENPAEILIRFSEGLKKVDDAGKDVNETLKDFGFQEIRVSKALSSLAQKHENLRTKISGANKELIENLALTKEVETAQKSFDASTIRLTNSFIKLSDSLSDIVLPPLTFLANETADVISGAASGFGEIIALIKGIRSGDLTIKKALLDPTPFDNKPDQGFFELLRENRERTFAQAFGQPSQTTTSTTQIDIQSVSVNADNGEQFVESIQNVATGSILPAGVPQ